MNQIPDTAKILTVSNVNNYIKAILSYDTNLSGIYVSGEISNFKIYNSGHAYFSLKDSGGLIKCVMFSSSVKELEFKPADGMKVLVYGSVSVYERDGVYQLYARKILPDGVGSLHMAYEELKKKLQSEGLFDAERKRTIPSLPNVLGVVTSEKGAVIRDIQNVVGRRFPTMNIKLFNVAVQGENASTEIVEALNYISKTKCCDVVIVGRGGGSIEDLWAFNEEKTVRAVAMCSVPVISAVGHETDFTLTDFASDLRAPTPSAAAELAVPILSELQDKLAEYRQKLQILPQTYIKIKQLELDRIKQSGVVQRYINIIDNKKMDMDMNLARLCELINNKYVSYENHLKMQHMKLEALNPVAVLKRGYSIVFDENEKVVMNASDVSIDDKVKVQTSNGKFVAKKISD